MEAKESKQPPFPCLFFVCVCVFFVCLFLHCLRGITHRYTLPFLFSQGLNHARGLTGWSGFPLNIWWTLNRNESSLNCPGEENKIIRMWSINICEHVRSRENLHTHYMFLIYAVSHALIGQIVWERENILTLLVFIEEKFFFSHHAAARPTNERQNVLWDNKCACAQAIKNFWSCKPSQMWQFYLQLSIVPYIWLFTRGKLSYWLPLSD